MDGRTIALGALIAAFSVVCVQGMDMGEIAKAIIVECSKQHNLEIDQIKDAAKNKKLPETEDGKCFLECVMEKVGVLEGGKLNAQRAKEINNMKLKGKSDILEKANKIVDKCSAEVKNPGGKCELGMELSKCAKKYAEEMGISDASFLD